MIAIVIETATEDEQRTAREMAARGYKKREVWVSSHLDKKDQAGEERALRALGVGQFVVGDCWGRGPD